MSVMDNIFDLTQGNGPRYERKFFISNSTPREIKSLIKLHPACFKEAFPQRRVNNIYLDSLSLENYLDNLSGANRRIKPRVRWYGDDFNESTNPFLEIKFKDNILGKKLRYPFEDFRIDRNLNKTLRSLISRSVMPEIIKFYLLQLRASSLNNYFRQYYVSADKKFRLTLDFDLCFYRPDAKLIERDRSNCILELKYDCECDSDARNVSAEFPFRMTKSSKYATGIEKLS